MEMKMSISKVPSFSNLHHQHHLPTQLTSSIELSTSPKSLLYPSLTHPSLSAHNHHPSKPLRKPSTLHPPPNAQKSPCFSDIEPETPQPSRAPQDLTKINDTARLPCPPSHIYIRTHISHRAPLTHNALPAKHPVAELVWWIAWLDAFFYIS